MEQKTDQVVDQATDETAIIDGASADQNNIEYSDSEVKSKKNWYIIQVTVGRESSARKNLITRMEEQNLINNFGEMLLPVEKVFEIVNGKKKEREKKLYPGYLFIEIEVNENNDILPECWHLIKKTKGVGGFVSGMQDSPAPTSPDTIEKIKQKMVDNKEKEPSVYVPFSINDQVTIKEGPFDGFTGSVDVINVERRRLTVMVMVFGRSTPVELDFTQVYKA